MTVLCLLCGGGVAQADVRDFIGRPVASVRLSIEDRDTTDPALMGAIETPVGQPLAMSGVRQTVTRLYRLGRFEDVRADASVENGGVALHYSLTPVHPVTKLQFAGGINAPGVDAGELRRAVMDRYGSSPLLGRQADMAIVVAQALGERGYLHPTITPRAEVAHNPERATIVFTIDPGPRTIIGSVDIAGSPTVPRAELLQRLGLSPGAPYQADALTTRIARYVDERRRRGYYEANLVPKVTLSENGQTADVALTVAPGPLVHLMFAGDPLPVEQRTELVPVEREGSVDEDLLEDSSHRIESFFHAQGYRDAKATYNRVETENELTVTFTVRKGPVYRVTGYELSGVTSIPIAELQGSLRVKEGQPFADASLSADVATIEEAYRLRGFASVRAQASVDVPPPPPTGAVVPVTITIAVTEGVQTRVAEVDFGNATGVDPATLRARIVLRTGTLYVPGRLAADRDIVQATYQDAGYTEASVDVTPRFSDDRTQVTLIFAIHEGPRIFVDRVQIVGNVRTPSEVIAREVRLKSGDPLSPSAIVESQRRLALLGLFRRVVISELRHGDNLSDLEVTVEEAPPTTISYGGGVEGKLRRVETPIGIAQDQFALAPRASFDIGRRNFFGKNRSINLSTSIIANRVGLQPNSTSDTNLTEYRIVGTYREPRLFETPADAFINGTVEQQLRTGFSFSRRSVSATIGQKITQTISVTGSYQLQSTRVFNEEVSPGDQLLIDRTFSQFLLSSFGATVIRDTRNDQVDPSAGNYASASIQVAAQRIGSAVGFVKSFFTAQLFRAVPHTPRIVFAGNARVGLAEGLTTITQDGVTAAGQLPTSERFFAGGDTTNRGFALDTLGVRHFPPQPGDTIDQNGFPIGGNGVVVMMGELRAPVHGGLGVVGFVDTGNVFARVSDIDLGAFRTAVGAGVRYRSPLGPLRFDVGVKVHQQPGEGLTAWFVSFGQAF